MVRLFLSVKLPNEICEKLSQFQKKLASVVEGTFVPLDNTHITLKFLGDVKEHQVEQIKSLCTSAITSYKFICEVKGAGAFPNPNYANVVWAGIGAGERSLIGIWNALDEKLSKLGFKDDKDFHPHITLVRVKRILNKDALILLLKNASETKFGQLRVEKISLMKSQLSKTGAKHTTIAEFELN